MPNVLNHLHRGANGCANLAFTTFAHIFLLLCTLLHISKFEGKSIFSSSDPVHGKGPRNIIITCMQLRLVGGGVGEEQFATIKFNSPF